MPTFTLKTSDLTGEMKVKIKDTVLYSLSQDPSQDKKEVLTRCVIATYAEYMVADWLKGYVNSGLEDHDAHAARRSSARRNVRCVKTKCAIAGNQERIQHGKGHGNAPKRRDRQLPAKEQRRHEHNGACDDGTPKLSQHVAVGVLHGLDVTHDGLG